MLRKLDGLQRDLEATIKFVTRGRGGTDIDSSVEKPESNAPLVPEIGAIEDGYRFLGGNPNDPASWEKVQ